LADKKKKKKESSPALAYESSEYKDLSKQVDSDIAEEKKAGPKKFDSLAGQITKDINEESTLADAGMGHPDAKALRAAGIPADRVKQLATLHVPSHPVAQGSADATPFTTSPSDPAQYAADVLQLAGLPVTADDEKMLETQMTVEGMPGNENNPLATSKNEPGATSVNSDGVKEYPSLIEGAQAEASTLDQSNMKSIYDALKSGDPTANQYASALANSSYEGSNPAANAQYSESFLKDSGEPESAFPASITSAAAGTDSSYGGSDAIGTSQGTNLFSNLSSVIPSLGSSAASSSLQNALAGLGSSAGTTLAANTTDAPGSPDQSNSQTQATNVNPAATYQAQLAALLGKNVQAGTAGKGT
jgi:hypothetical protein